MSHVRIVTYRPHLMLNLLVQQPYIWSRESRKQRQREETQAFPPNDSLKMRFERVKLCGGIENYDLDKTRHLLASGPTLTITMKGTKTNE